MNYLSVCSGIEAATVAWHPLGWRPWAFSEIDAFPSALLAHYYPVVPNLGDMTRFKDWTDACDCDSRREQSGAKTARRWLEGRRDDVHAQHAGSAHGRAASDGGLCARCGGAAIDLLVGGTPCQSFSPAGLRAGLDDPRGQLLLVYLAIARRYRPRWVVWENVPGVLSSDKGAAFGSLLGGLAELGYGFAYRVLDAQFFRVAQRRRRVFVVGYLGDWRRAAAVLFERESLSGHPAPRREARQGSACGALRSSDGGSDDNRAAAHHIVPQAFGGNNTRGPIDVATAVNAHGGPHGRVDFESETFIAFDTTQITSPENRSNPQPGGPAPSLARGAHPPAIAFAHCTAGDHTTSMPVEAEMSPTLRAGQTMAVAFDARQSDVIQYGDKTGPLDTDGHTVGVIYQDSQFGVGEYQSAGALRAGRIPEHQMLMSATMQVRRLTPLECERLQGFPDNYTLIPYGKRGKPAKDGPRYKALGNSMAVPCMYWIGRRIQMVEELIRGDVA